MPEGNPSKKTTSVLLDCGQTGHYSDSIWPLEVQGGIMRQDGSGLAGWHTNISRYLCNTYIDIFDNVKMGMSVNNLRQLLNVLNKNSYTLHLYSRLFLSSLSSHISSIYI